MLKYAANNYQPFFFFFDSELIIIVMKICDQSIDNVPHHQEILVAMITHTTYRHLDQ